MAVCGDHSPADNKSFEKNPPQITTAMLGLHFWLFFLSSSVGTLAADLPVDGSASLSPPKKNWLSPLLKSFVRDVYRPIFDKNLVLGRTNFAPDKLVDFLAAHIPKLLDTDFVLYYEKIRRDWMATGAAAFPVLCLVYAPFWLLVALVLVSETRDEKRETKVSHGESAIEITTAPQWRVYRAVSEGDEVREINLAPSSSAPGGGVEDANNFVMVGEQSAQDRSENSLSAESDESASLEKPPDADNQHPAPDGDASSSQQNLPQSQYTPLPPVTLHPCSDATTTPPIIHDTDFSKDSDLKRVPVLRLSSSFQLARGDVLVERNCFVEGENRADACDELFSMRDARILLLLSLVVLGGAGAGGVVWKNYSSEGMGAFQV